MANLNYGGFECDEPDYDSAMEKLASVQNHLEDDGQLPPHLARWLGQAINLSLQADEPGKELLVQLGLANKPQRPRNYPQDSWLVWGSRMDQLIDEGANQSQAIEQMQFEFEQQHGTEPDRRTFQRWYKEWIAALEENRRIADEESHP